MFEIVTLRQGERAIRDRESGEIMHPSVGPWAEANRLYVDQSRLEDALCQPGSEPHCIYDIGLGGGANAVAALARARALGLKRKRALTVVSFDLTTDALELAAADGGAFPFLVPWRSEIQALVERGAARAEGIDWRFLAGDFHGRLVDAPVPADVVFFDPFSPKANPDCWSVETLRAVRARMRSSPPARLFTYSAATPTRAALLVAGFCVGAGVSVATKAETTVAATAVEALAQPLGARWLARWERSPHRAPHGTQLTPELERAVRAHPQFAG